MLGRPGCLKPAASPPGAVSHLDIVHSMNAKPIPALALTLTCLAVVAGLLAAGLWPLNFRTENHVAPIPSGGLKFSAPSNSSKSELGGIVFTPLPLKCHATSGCREGEISLTIGLSAGSEACTCLKRILDLRGPNGSEAFYFGQWKSYFIVRTFNAPAAAGKSYREIGVRDVLAAGRQSVITVTSSSAGTSIYVHGRLTGHYPGFRLLQEHQMLQGHRLYLGNAPDLNCPWPGDVFSLALYARALTPEEACDAGRRREDYGGTGAAACWDFGSGAEQEVAADLSGSGNALDMPRNLVFTKRFLGWPDFQHLPLSDLALNLLGFVPFGFLMSLRILTAGRLSMRRTGLAALTLGFGVSLLIETVQVFLPGRDSSLLDLAANTVGTGAGTLIALVPSMRSSH